MGSKTTKGTFFLIQQFKSKLGLKFSDKKKKNVTKGGGAGGGGGRAQGEGG